MRLTMTAYLSVLKQVLEASDGPLMKVAGDGWHPEDLSYHVGIVNETIGHTLSWVGEMEKQRNRNVV